MFKNSSPFTAWDIHFTVFSGTIWSCETLKPVAPEDKKLDYDNNI